MFKKALKIGKRSTMVYYQLKKVDKDAIDFQTNLQPTHVDLFFRPTSGLHMSTFFFNAPDVANLGFRQIGPKLSV